MAEQTSHDNAEGLVPRRVFGGESRKVMCGDVSGFDCRRVMADDAENCGIASHVRSVPIGTPRGEADYRTRSSVYRRRLIVDEEYELVFEDSLEPVELDRASFDPNRLWVSAKVQREFTEYHGCEADEAIANVRLVVRKALEEGRYAPEEWGGHFFWWSGYFVTADPSLDVAIRYRTYHYERTPRQVAEGVKSRLSKKGALRNLKRVFPVEIAVGDIVDGVVSNIVNFGVFIRITDDYDALLHKSELGVDSESALKTFVPGDQIRVEVVHIDSESERVNVRPVVSDGT